MPFERTNLNKQQTKAARFLERAMQAAHKAGLELYICSGSPIVYDARQFRKVEDRSSLEDAMRELQNDEIANESLTTKLICDGGDF